MKWLKRQDWYWAFHHEWAETFGVYPTWLPKPNLRPLRILVIED